MTVSPRKTATHFHSEHHQACAGASADQFRICGLFAPSCSCHSDPIFHSGSGGGPTVPPQRTHQGGVNSQLGTVEDGEATTISSRLPSASAPKPRSGSTRTRWLSLDLHLRGRSVLQHSPEPTLTSPEHPHVRTLHGGGPKRREDGHTGRCAR